MKTMIFIFVLATAVFAQEIIEISVKGISDKQNDGAQQDRLEAILDAKRQACEKAGLTIESKTTVENFEVVYDFVETQAATVLLPGFQLIEIGYVQDGTYQVVLSGKIKAMAEGEKMSSKEMRYAKSLRDRGKNAECESILIKYIDSKEKDVPEELKEEAFYYFIKWGYAFNLADEVSKFTAYYPESKQAPILESFAAFAVNPLYVHKKTYQSDAGKWQKTELKHNDITFTKKIRCAADTILLKAFNGKDQTILLDFILYSDEQEKTNAAYKIILSYYDGNLKQSGNSGEIKLVEDWFRLFQSGVSMTFQHSSSGVQFKVFRLKGLMISGDVPVGKGPFEQSLQFEIYQKSF
ncbi:MAG: hypothetical protein JXR46_08225 [Calditrichaceae bacterium]|nr:hypothetical protein [Calditrichaceae bacterium]MBN2709016.1 hypothetical protein [Calditrichaceae bacterium]RQV95332.1 MAG: hypothetical protein EH224_07910 [Calditrichota bacterium]